MGETGGSIGDVLGAEDAAAVAAAHQQRQWVHRPGHAGRFSALFGWDSLSRILETVPLAQPRLELVRGGQEIGQVAYLREREGVLRLDAGALSRELDAGATLIVNFLDELAPPVAQLCDDLAGRLEVRTAANLYASWRAESGLALHADRHGVLVLQLEGSKDWTVYPPGGEDEPVWAGTLEEGAWLYLPEGYPHCASAAQAPSLHLTIALTDLVREGTGPADPAALPRHRAERLAAKMARAAFAFPDLGRQPPSEWTPQTRLRLASARRLAVWDEGQGAAVLLGGNPWPCASAAGTALARLRDRESLTLADLEQGLDPASHSELRRLLGVLFLTGGLSATSGGLP